MPRGDLLLALVVMALTLLLAEMSSRQEASTRWCIVALIWLIVVGMLIWLAYG
jgi:hypothetical protein